MALPGARAWLIPFVEAPSCWVEAFRLTNAVVGRDGGTWRFFRDVFGKDATKTIPWTLKPMENEGFTPQNMGYNP